MNSGSSEGNQVGNGCLADAWQRLEWANSDGESFSAISKWFGEAGAYAVHVESDGNRWQARWHRFIEPEIEAEKFAELSRLLGSFLDHSRAALNYATYQLAKLAIREDPTLHGDLHPDAVEFPIFENSELFNGKNRIKKLPDKYRAAIETVQPYDGRNAGLWILHELSREYRHRVLHPTAILPAEDLYRVLVNGEIVMPPDLEIVAHERLEHGDVVMHFTLDTSDPSPAVHPQVAIAVGVDHVLCRGLIGTSVLNQIRHDVTPVLNVIGEFFA